MTEPPVACIIIEVQSLVQS